MKYFLILLLSTICFCQESAFTSETYNLNNYNSKSSSYEFKFSVVPKAEFEYFIGEEKFSKYVSDNDTTDFKYGKFKARVGIDFKYGPFTIYFDTDTYVNTSDKSVSFAPRHADFYSGFSINMKENIKLSFEHLCQHPISSYDTNRKNIMYGGYSSIKISYNY